MKKALFVATVDVHIRTFHLPYLKLLHDNGYEVHVATNGDEEFPNCDKKYQICIERSPFKLKNLKAIKQLRKIIEEEKYDLIHCHTPMGSVVTRLAARKARKKYGTRVIYTAHGFHFYKGAPKLNWLLFYPIEKWLAKYTDTLITINKEDYNLAKNKFSKRCHDIQYIPGVGIDTKKFDIKMTEKDKNELRKSIGLKKDDFVIIYPAEISNRKRQEWLINSISNLLIEHSNIHLLLPGRDSLNGKCQELSKKLGLEKQIHFLGFRNDIPKLLKISNLSISSSLQEGLPVNIMEAMYVGLPIIATNCRGNGDLIENEKNGYLVDLNDSKSFSKYIEKVYLNENKDKFGIESQKIIKDYLLDKVLFDFNKMYFKKKKIAYLRSTAIYNDSRATKEIDSYSKLNNDVLVFGWNRNLDDIILKKDNNSYYLYDLKSGYGGGFKNIFKMIKFEIWLYRNLKKHIYEYDIIHACDFDTSFVASYISKKYNKKLIYDIYDYYIDSHSLGKLNSIIEKQDIKIINSADYTIICTEKRKEQISKANPRKVVVIHNSPFIIEKVHKMKFDKSKLIVGYFGILQDYRLLIEISEEIIKHPDIILHIGGFGKYDNYFEELAKTHNNIYYYGTLPYDKVLEEEIKCDVLFATYDPSIKNHKYAAPNKVYEAMALNLPIIVCKNTGVDEMVEHEKTGCVINYNAKEFIQTLYNLKKKDFSNGRDIFRKKYSWNVMETKLKKIINDLRG